MSTFNNGAVDNNFASDAEWRAWCEAFEDALLASGFLIPAADTGQLDLTTAARPSAGTFAGFKMYKGADELQATKPVFVKVEYGCATPNSRPRIQVALGTSTNGSGTLGGQVSSTSSILNPSVDGSGTCRIFGGGGEFDAWVVVHDGSISSQTCHFQVGRLVDRDDGSAEVGPITWFSYSSSGTGTPFGNLSYTDGTFAWATVSQGLFSFAPDLSLPIHSGGDINKTLLYEMLVYRNAMTLVFPLVAGRAQELPYTDPDASSFSMSVWGGNHTFVPIPWASGANNRPCLLWE